MSVETTPARAGAECRHSDESDTPLEY